jgi:hypothetical protein
VRRQDDTLEAGIVTRLEEPLCRDQIEIACRSGDVIRTLGSAISGCLDNMDIAGDPVNAYWYLLSARQRMRKLQDEIIQLLYALHFADLADGQQSEDAIN